MSWVAEHPAKPKPFHGRTVSQQPCCIFFGVRERRKPKSLPTEMEHLPWTEEVTAARRCQRYVGGFHILLGHLFWGRFIGMRRNVCRRLWLRLRRPSSSSRRYHSAAFGYFSGPLPSCCTNYTVVIGNVLQTETFYHIVCFLYSMSQICKCENVRNAAPPSRCFPA